MGDDHRGYNVVELGIVDVGQWWTERKDGEGQAQRTRGERVDGVGCEVRGGKLGEVA
jgi:hypothetical protein